MSSTIRGDPEPIHEEPPNMLPVCEALAQLPDLGILKLKGSGLDMEAVEQLARLTKLTRLTMSGEVSKSE